MGWSHCAHVSSSEHNWNCVLIQHPEELLRDVVPAHGVLKGEVELVLFTQHIKTPSFLPGWAEEISTVAIDVNWSEIVNHVDQVLTTHCSLTV